MAASITGWLALGGLALVVWTMLPLASPLLIAAAIAGAFYPLHLKLARKLRGRPKLSAVMICLAVFILLLLPLVGVGAVIARNISAAGAFVRDSLQGGGFDRFVESLPGPLERVGEWLQNEVPRVDRIEELLAQQGGKAAQAARSALAGVGRFGFNAILMLVALYLLLVDGARLLRWIERVSPLGPDDTRQLLHNFRDVSVGVIIATVGTAAAQAALALVGYFIAGVPHALSFGLISFFLALIPFVGGAVTGIALSGLLMINGRWIAALFLLGWSIGVVGLADNVLRPLIMRGDVPISGGILFFSLLGGLATFGAVGLLLGPLIVSFFLAASKLHVRDR
jgi:predicted PurR-regulated permease PerM